MRETTRTRTFMQLSTKRNFSTWNDRFGSCFCSFLLAAVGYRKSARAARLVTLSSLAPRQLEDVCLSSIRYLTDRGSNRRQRLVSVSTPR